MADRTLATELQMEPEGLPMEMQGGPPCPVDRLPRRRRNQMCIWIIAVGLLNFLAYTVCYAAIGGDAFNGYVTKVKTEDGQTRTAFFVAGHFIRDLQGRDQQVPRGVWIYSYLHSLTVPITSAALIVSMLVLARPHIIATMRDGWISGSTFVTAFGTIIIVGTLFVVTLLIWKLLEQLQKL